MKPMHLKPIIRKLLLPARPSGLTRRVGLLALAAGLLLGACDMVDASYYEPYEANAFYQDGTSARPVPPNTIPYGTGEEDMVFLTGRTEDGSLTEEFPIEVDGAVLERGRKEYDTFCAPCHGLAGYGDGMIVQRGFSAPPSLHSTRLIQAEAGHYYDVITNGFGQMYAYGYRVEPDDRWAIIAYVRALQLSQNVNPQDLPADLQQELESAQ